MPDFLIGLDLGQSKDPTALAILRRALVLDATGLPVRDHRGELAYQFSCIHLDRHPLGTDYPAVVAKVAALVRESGLLPDPWLAIDATGIGRAVVDLFLNERMPARVVPITITGGDTVRRDRWNRSGSIGYWTPKTELVSAVQAGLQSRRLKLLSKLPLAETLRRELTDFRVNVTRSATETYAAREGSHDDLVIAVAMALWLGGRREIAFRDAPQADKGRDAQALDADSAREQAALKAEHEQAQTTAEKAWLDVDNPIWWPERSS